MRVRRARLWHCAAAVRLGAVPAWACGNCTPRRVCESVDSNIGFSLGTPRSYAFESCGAFVPVEMRRKLRSRLDCTEVLRALELKEGTIHVMGKLRSCLLGESTEKVQVADYTVRAT